MLCFTGCTVVSNPAPTLTPFPLQPKNVEYTRNPVVSYNKTNETYTITKEMMHNTVNDKLFVTEILKWKTANGVQ